MLADPGSINDMSKVFRRDKRGIRTMDLELYYAAGACSLAPHVALEEVGTSFKAIRVNLAAGKQRSAEYLAINPRGRVPTLVAGGRVISENIAILTCIVNLFPQAALLPSENPVLLAHAYDLMSWLASTVHVSIAQIWRTERFTQDLSAATALQRDGLTNVSASYRIIERMIEGDWVLGDRYSVLDPYLLVFWRWGERLHIDMSTFPKWSAHTARVMARPAVIRTLAREVQQEQ